MKLNIGRTIRTLRRAKDMTQDELAAKLGVTFQTVSRWENGSTYPDMELLPVIAGIFDVSIDHLLGTDTEEKEEHLREIVKCLQNAVRERADDTVIGILRELRRDMRQYADCITGMNRVWLTLRWYKGSASPELLEEVRQFHQEYILYAPAMENLWWPAWAMTVIEDEAHLEDHLKKYCANRKFTVEELLLDRYSLRKEEEKLSYAEELCRYTTLRKLFEDNEKLTVNDRGMTEYNLACLHLLHGVTPDPDHPISGDGSLDLWVDLRIRLGWRLAELCIDRGEIDRAVTVLSDVIGLHETLMEQAEKAKNEKRWLELTSTASILPTFKITALPGWGTLYGDGDVIQIYDVELRYNSFGDSFRTSTIVSSKNDYARFQMVCGDFYDDPRFIKLRERMEALIRTKKV